MTIYTLANKGTTPTSDALMRLLAFSERLSFFINTREKYIYTLEEVLANK